MSDWVAVEAHLETCPHCLARLASVPRSDPLLDRLRAAGHGFKAYYRVPTHSSYGALNSDQVR